jgi:hypothetical protein
MANVQRFTSTHIPFPGHQQKRNTRTEKLKNANSAVRRSRGADRMGSSGTMGREGGHIQNAQLSQSASQWGVFDCALKPRIALCHQTRYRTTVLRRDWQETVRKSGLVNLASAGHSELPYTERMGNDQGARPPAQAVAKPQANLTEGRSPNVLKPKGQGVRTVILSVDVNVLGDHIAAGQSRQNLKCSFASAKKHQCRPAAAVCPS